MEWPNHDSAWQEWRSALDGSKMHHAWLLAGNEGLGKHEFAVAAARELVVSEGVMQPENDHPDIHLLTYLPKDDKAEKAKQDGKPYETKRSIGVDQIRAMQSRLTTRPTLGARRAIIIKPADDLETAASNALLKSLEEPPQGTFFLLVTHRPAKLLPTIRSRCRIVRFGAVGPDRISAFLDEMAPEADPATRAAALASCHGSPGMALQFVEQELGEIAELIDLLLTKGDPDLTLRSRFARAFGAKPNRARLQAILGLARTKLAARLREVDTQGQARLIAAHEALVRLAAEAPTYNFDAGLLAQQTGGLLAGAAEASA
jgi:DNA polymerase-3 subunit delta'